MKISILTLFPELYQPFINTSLMRRAQEKDLVHFDVESMFALAQPKERIDGPTFGHGPGLVLRPDIVEKGIKQQEAKFGKSVKIFFSPHGKKLNQDTLSEIYQKIEQSRGKHCCLLPARYEGMDARLEEHYADEVVSIGDYVLMGGDLPAMVLLEGLLRFVPGVVGKAASVTEDSFSGPLVDYPHYTAPVEWKGYTVPSVLRSGNHAKIAQWRKEQSVDRTVYGHFDWLRSHAEAVEVKEVVREELPSHYAALLHTGVLQQDGSEGTTSVTSIDIHDVARSAATFGLSHYYVVTSLLDQQKIVQRLLEFWQAGGPGETYNVKRFQALEEVSLKASLQQAIDDIVKREGQRPIIIGTSAREVEGKENITYYEQKKVWQRNRPVLMLFGTGSGLGPSIIQECDYILLPVHGFSSFNHLSVRSAAAIVLDRWLGINIKYKKRQDS